MTPAPADAIVLFDGTSLDKFVPSKCTIVDGAIRLVGGITTKDAFGDCQLHIECAHPDDDQHQQD